jgi:Na+/proline symporter
MRLSLTVSLGAALLVIALGGVERRMTTFAALAIGVVGSTYLGHLVDRGVARGDIPTRISGFVTGALGFGGALAVPTFLELEMEPSDRVWQLLLAFILGGLFTGLEALMKRRNAE